MKVYAFIPARSGSKGLPDKNILPIDGHPLLAYSVAFGRALGIDRVFVSTDSEKYAEIARAYGAECPFMRSAEASSDTAMEESIIEDMTQKFPDHGIDIPDIWMRLKPTNPFRSLESVHKAIDILKTEPDVQSVRIISETEGRLVTINDNGWLEPMSDRWDFQHRSVMRRTEFPKAYSPYNLDVIRHENWVKHGSAYMGHRIKPIVEHGITGLDINDSDDFEIIKAIIETRPRPEFLKRFLPEMPDQPLTAT
ncbi:MAG: acylneuraminate cytidylyltransferase family protein [Pseudomonadota bacterium]